MSKNIAVVLLTLFFCMLLLSQSACKKKDTSGPLTPEELQQLLAAQLAKMSDSEKWMYYSKNVSVKRFQLNGKVSKVVETIEGSTTGIVQKTTYEFDAEGRLTVSKLQTMMAGKLETIADTVMTINNNRIISVTKERKTDSNPKEKVEIAYSYTDFGNFQNIVTQTYQDDNRTGKEETIYTYQEDTLLMNKRVLVYKNGGQTVEQSTDTIYSYTNKIHKIDKIAVVKYGATLIDTIYYKITQYHYNESEQLESIEDKVRTKAVMGTPGSEDEYIDEYIYDTHGNWTEKKQWILVKFEETLGLTTKREITYHQ